MALSRVTCTFTTWTRSSVQDDRCVRQHASSPLVSYHKFYLFIDHTDNEKVSKWGYRHFNDQNHQWWWNGVDKLKAPVNPLVEHRSVSPAHAFKLKKFNYTDDLHPSSYRWVNVRLVKLWDDDKAFKANDSNEVSEVELNGHICDTTEFPVVHRRRRRRIWLESVLRHFCLTASTS